MLTRNKMKESSETSSGLEAKWASPLNSPEQKRQKKKREREGEGESATVRCVAETLSRNKHCASYTVIRKTE